MRTVCAFWGMILGVMHFGLHWGGAWSLAGAAVLGLGALAATPRRRVGQ